MLLIWILHDMAMFGSIYELGWPAVHATRHLSLGQPPILRPDCHNPLALVYNLMCRKTLHVFHLSFGNQAWAIDNHLFMEAFPMFQTW
jgi:hypothetical protein